MSVVAVDLPQAWPYGRWTDADIERFADFDKTKRIQLIAGGAELAAMIIAFIAAPQAIWIVGLAGVVVLAATMYALYQPHRNLERYQELKAQWEDLVAKSAPDAAMTCAIPLKEGESVTFRQTVDRMAETRPANGLPGIAVIDSGDLIITSQRVVFLGKRNTLEMPLDTILRYTSDTAGRLVLEYPKRLAGECYSVDLVLFTLCLVRRGRLKAARPQPTWPLPLSLEAR